MNKIAIRDKTLRTFTPGADVSERVKAVAEQVNTDSVGKEPLFPAMLNGFFVFAVDLIRYITIPSEIPSVKLTSYQGTAPMGVIKEVIGLNEDIINRHVVTVEGIVDTGATMRCMIEALDTRSPTPIGICILLLKSGKLSVPSNIEYVTMEIPNDFIVDYGLGYEQQGRNLRDVHTLVEE